MGANLRQICSRGRNATHRLYPSWAPSAARPQLPGVLATLFSSAPAGMKEGIVLVVEKKKGFLTNMRHSAWIWALLLY